MAYDGQGQRLAMTAHQGSQSLTSHYLLDGSQTLAATANGQTTYYLRGVGEYQTDWRYYLADGMGNVRQVIDGQGQVAGTRSYTPWGEILAQSGQTDLTTGYLGGMLDAATGLIYIGNGQYYDPATGRFLTRDANPSQTNPYVPWKSDPAGAMLAPLALLAMVYGGKKKRGKWDQLVIVVVLCLTTGAALTACTNSRPNPGPVEIRVSPNPTFTPTSTPTAKVTVTVDGKTETATIPSPTATATKIPSTINCTVLTTPEPGGTLVPAPNGLNDYGEKAYEGLQKLGLYGKTIDALSQAVVEEYTDVQLLSLQNEKPETSAQYLTIAFTRRYYHYCRDGAWTGSCLNGFWGYLQFSYSGVQTRCPTSVSAGMSDAVLNFKPYGGIIFIDNWKTGCGGGGLCHWANTRFVALADAIKRDSVPSYDDPNHPNQPTSWSQVPASITSNTPVTYLFWQGGSDYYVVANEAAYKKYYSENPEWFWNGN